MKQIVFIFSLIFCLAITGCQAQERVTSPTPPSHAAWDALLTKHVRKDGMIDYRGFVDDKGALENYLNTLSSHAPDPARWSREQQLAYWINAYNAYTIKLIVDNYPVESIQDLHPTVHIPGVSTVWHKKFFSIGEVKTSLDEIEHSILRKEFDEPRIHFAINCASFSCPPLRAEAYTADKLEAQLDDMARRFINDGQRNKITADNPQLSKIFSWFTGDFTRSGTLIEFVNKYSETVIRADADIDYLPYDWSLNDVR